MALFKISKGLKANLPKTYTEGFCYFTTDDGKFYIDTNNTAAGRIPLNAEQADKLKNFINNNTTALLANQFTTNGIGYVKDNSLAGFVNSSEGGLFSHVYNSSWATQLVQDYRNGSIVVRGNANGWSDWKKVLDSGNYEDIIGTATNDKIGLIKGSTDILIDENGKATINKNSIALTGVPTAPTASTGTNTTQIATTAFVKAACDAVLTSEMTFKGATSSLPTSPNNGDMWKVSADIAKTGVMETSAKKGDTLIYSTTGPVWYIVPSGDDIEDTWRTIQVNGNAFKGGGTSTGLVNFKAGSNTTLTSSGNDITIASSDVKVTQTNDTTNTWRSILSGAEAMSTSTATPTTQTTTSYKVAGVAVQPSTATIQAAQVQVTSNVTFNYDTTKKALKISFV